jgi:mono/diheme cytochrome c family protein
MPKLKLSIIFFFALFAVFVLLACGNSDQKGVVIADSKKYEASLFRQNCAICHGAEAEGRTLDDGKIVPSLRSGDFKFKTKAEIYKQISEGGNGMTPFRRQLTERELNLMTDFVYTDLRGNQ